VKFTKNTPTAGVVYAVKPGLNAYASFSENFYPRNAAAQDLIKNSVTGEQRGGGVNAPEIGRGYEFGLKTLSADGKISGSIALFRIDRSNMPLVDTLFANRTVKENEAAGTAFPWRNVTQNNAPITQANAPQLTLPIGRQRVEGVEIESVYAPARNWQIIFAASHNFTRRWRELPPDRLNVAHGGTFTGYNGQNDGRDAYSYTLPNIPANQASIFSKYTLNDGKYKGLYFTGGVQWQSDSQLPLSYDDRIDPFSAGSIQKAYYVVDLGVGYSFKVAARPLKLAFTVNNALNKEYITGSFGPAPTREWRVTATYQF
jgi:outer membrane receptor protein involved in Fe transport